MTKTIQNAGSIKEIRRRNEEKPSIMEALRKEVLSEVSTLARTLPFAAAVFLGSQGALAQSVPRIDSIRTVNGTNLEFIVSNADPLSTCVLAGKTTLGNGDLSDNYTIVATFIPDYNPNGYTVDIPAPSSPMHFYTVAELNNCYTPTVTICSPQDNSVVSGSVQVKAMATSLCPNVWAQLSVDGRPYQTNYTGPLSFPMDTTTLTNGPHNFAVSVCGAAYDGNGNLMNFTGRAALTNVVTSNANAPASSPRFKAAAISLDAVQPALDSSDSGATLVQFTANLINNPNFTCTPNGLVFGNVVVGQTAVLPFKVVNTGGSPATITSIAFTQQGGIGTNTQWTASGITIPATLAAGNGSAIVKITYAPTVMGGVRGNIILNMADGTTAIEQVVANGVGTHSVQFGWDPVDPALGVNVWRATQDGGPYALQNVSGPVMNASVWTDSYVQAGVTYYYVATSQDPLSGQDSGRDLHQYSDQVEWIAPYP